MDLQKGNRRREWLRCLRFEFELVSGNGPMGTLIGFLLPMFFVLIIWAEAIRSVAFGLMVVFTLGYWVLSVGALFVSGGGESAGRLISVIPVRRRAQVTARYAVAGLFILLAVVELACEIMLATVLFGFEGLGADALAMLLFGSAVALCVIMAFEIPFYFAHEYTWATQVFVVSCSMMVCAVSCIGIILPDAVVQRTAAAVTSLPPGAGYAGGAVAGVLAVTVSYLLSMRIWTAKEF